MDVQFDPVLAGRETVLSEQEPAFNEAAAAVPAVVLPDKSGN
jgi:hypothetical protein